MVNHQPSPSRVSHFNESGSAPSEAVLRNCALEATNIEIVYGTGQVRRVSIGWSHSWNRSDSPATILLSVEFSLPKVHGTPSRRKLIDRHGWSKPSLEFSNCTIVRVQQSEAGFMNKSNASIRLANRISYFIQLFWKKNQQDTLGLIWTSLVDQCITLLNYQWSGVSSVAPPQQLMGWWWRLTCASGNSNSQFTRITYCKDWWDNDGWIDGGYRCYSCPLVIKRRWPEHHHSVIQSSIAVCENRRVYKPTTMGMITIVKG